MMDTVRTCYVVFCGDDIDGEFEFSTQGFRRAKVFAVATGGTVMVERCAYDADDHEQCTYEDA